MTNTSVNLRAKNAGLLVTTKLGMSNIGNVMKNSHLVQLLYRHNMSYENTITPTKERNVEQVVRFLTHTFEKAIGPLDRAARTKNGPNLAYRLQTEFAYRINEVQQGPKCMLQYNITSVNQYIDDVMIMMSDNRR